MKKMLNLIIGILALIGLLVVGVNIVGPKNVFGPSCTSIILRQTQSPDDQILASIVSQTCDKPQDSGVHIYFRRIGTGDMSGIRIADNTSTKFEMTWASNERLEISGDVDMLPGETIGSIFDVWIRYSSGN